MKTKATMGMAGILGAFLIGTAPAEAQIQPHKSEIHVYAGELFGDDLTDKAISGRTPKLDDDFTYGVRYGYDLTESWGVEVSGAYSASSTKDAAGGDTNLNLGILDVDAVWHFTPRARVVGYLIGGAGYAIGSLDHPIAGTVAGTPVSIGDDSGFTLNAGIGAKFFATKTLMVRVEARYRYLDRLVNRFDAALDTVETTAGVGWRF